MHSKNHSLLAPLAIKTRPKVLKLHFRDIQSSDCTGEDRTPHFRNVEASFKPMSSYNNLRAEAKPPRHLPPLLPLLHTPKNLGVFLFKTPSKKEEAIKTFRYVKSIKRSN